MEVLGSGVQGMIYRIGDSEISGPREPATFLFQIQYSLVTLGKLLKSPNFNALNYKI